MFLLPFFLFLAAISGPTGMGPITSSSSSDGGGRSVLIFLLREYFSVSRNATVTNRKNFICSGSRCVIRKWRARIYLWTCMSLTYLAAQLSSVCPLLLFIYCLKGVGRSWKGFSSLLFRSLFHFWGWSGYLDSCTPKSSMKFAFLWTKGTWNSPCNFMQMLSYVWAHSGVNMNYWTTSTRKCAKFVVQWANQKLHG